MMLADLSMWVVCASGGWCASCYRVVHLCVVVDRGYVGWHGRRWGKDRRRVEQAGKKREVEIREPYFSKCVPVIGGS